MLWASSRHGYKLLCWNGLFCWCGRCLLSRCISLTLQLINSLGASGLKLLLAISLSFHPVLGHI